MAPITANAATVSESWALPLLQRWQEAWEASGNTGTRSCRQCDLSLHPPSTKRRSLATEPVN